MNESKSCLLSLQEIKYLVSRCNVFCKMQFCRSQFLNIECHPKSVKNLHFSFQVFLEKEIFNFNGTSWLKKVLK